MAGRSWLTDKVCFALLITFPVGLLSFIRNSNEAGGFSYIIQIKFYSYYAERLKKRTSKIIINYSGQFETCN